MGWRCRRYNWQKVNFMATSCQFRVISCQGWGAQLPKRPKIMVILDYGDDMSWPLFFQETGWCFVLGIFWCYSFYSVRVRWTQGFHILWTPCDCGWVFLVKTKRLLLKQTAEVGVRQHVSEFPVTLHVPLLHTLSPCFKNEEQVLILWHGTRTKALFKKLCFNNMGDM